MNSVNLFRVLAKIRIGKTIEYTFSLLLRLSRHVNNRRVSINNNWIENAIRQKIFEQEKLSHLCDKDASAYKVFIVYFLIGICEPVGVDPII